MGSSKLQLGCFTQGICTSKDRYLVCVDYTWTAVFPRNRDLRLCVSDQFFGGRERTKTSAGNKRFKNVRTVARISTFFTNSYSELQFLSHSLKFSTSQAMNLVGLYDSAYWLSWLTWEGFLSFLSSLFIVVFGMLFRYDFFLNNSSTVVFLVFFLFQLNMVRLNSLVIFFFLMSYVNLVFFFFFHF